MSLYDKFHSDINKKFMFDMIQEMILNELKYDISEDESNYSYFLSSLPKIFEENNFDDIKDFNKVLLDHNFDYFRNKINNSEEKVQEDYQKLIQEREQLPLEELKETKRDIVDEVKLEDKHEEGTQTIQKIDEPIQKVYSPKNINSSYRTNIHSSRYNYKVDLVKQSIDSEDLKSVSKIIIPIEDNYLFSLPLLNIHIPELDCKIHLQQEEIIQKENRNYGVFRSIENHSLNQKNIYKITIDIRDITGKKYTQNDILKVNLVEIKENIILFTCSNIHKNDFQEKDYIKIINNNTPPLYSILQNPLKIKKIKKNIITCYFDGYFESKNNIYNDIDMKIMNMSNQNIIYFN